MSATSHLTAAVPEAAPHGGTADGSTLEHDHPAYGPSCFCPSPQRKKGHCGPTPDARPDRFPAVAPDRRPARPWPLLVLAAPAAVAIWSGLVGIGQMTGFGDIRPLPGIWNALHINTAVTLPIGVEAYAAFALRAWLTASPAISERTRRFARWSAIAALVLGMTGQAAYHLLTQAGITRAPWEITTLVSCLPVLVLGMGTALTHLLHADATAAIAAADHLRDRNISGAGDATMPATCCPDHPDQDRSGWDRLVIMHGQCRDAQDHPPGRGDSPDRHEATSGHGPTGQHQPGVIPGFGPRAAEARAAAAQLTASGQRIFRRNLRSAGLHGSNADLGMLARQIRSGWPAGKHGTSLQQPGAAASDLPATIVPPVGPAKSRARNQ